MFSISKSIDTDNLSFSLNFLSSLSEFSSSLQDTDRNNSEEKKYNFEEEERHMDKLPMNDERNILLCNSQSFHNVPRKEIKESELQKEMTVLEEDGKKSSVLKKREEEKDADNVDKCEKHMSLNKRNEEEEEEDIQRQTMPLEISSAHESIFLEDVETHREKIRKVQHLMSNNDIYSDDSYSSSSAPSFSSYRKWESMVNRNLEMFMQTHRTTFIRRFRRSVPQEFRWEAWKVVSDFYGITGRREKNNEEVKMRKQIYENLALKKSPFANIIRIDIPRTFPELNVFDEFSQNQLFRILNAYANYAPEVGYCQGMNFITGLLLLVSNFNEEESFWVLTGLMRHYDLRGFYSEKFPLLRRFVKAFDELCAIHIPELRQHFKDEGVLPPMYLHQWFLTLYVTSLPLRTVVVVWDYLLCEGIYSLLSLTIALLKVLQKFLLRLHFEDMIKFLKALKSTSGCDDNKIGRMLIKQADKVFIPSRIMKSVTEVDMNKLIQEAEKEENNEGRWDKSNLEINNSLKTGFAEPKNRDMRENSLSGFDFFETSLGLSKDTNRINHHDGSASFEEKVGEEESRVEEYEMKTVAHRNKDYAPDSCHSSSSHFPFVFPKERKLFSSSSYMLSSAISNELFNSLAKASQSSVLLNREENDRRILEARFKPRITLFNMSSELNSFDKEGFEDENKEEMSKLKLGEEKKDEACSTDLSLKFQNVYDSFFSSASCSSENFFYSSFRNPFSTKGDSDLCVPSTIYDSSLNVPSGSSFAHHIRSSYASPSYILKKNNVCVEPAASSPVLCKQNIRELSRSVRKNNYSRIINSHYQQLHCSSIQSMLNIDEGRKYKEQLLHSGNKLDNDNKHFYKNLDEFASCSTQANNKEKLSPTHNVSSEKLIESYEEMKIQVKQEENEKGGIVLQSEEQNNIDFQHNDDNATCNYEESNKFLLNSFNFFSSSSFLPFSLSFSTDPENREKENKEKENKEKEKDHPNSINKEEKENVKVLHNNSKNHTNEDANTNVTDVKSYSIFPYTKTDFCTTMNSSLNFDDTSSSFVRRSLSFVILPKETTRSSLYLLKDDIHSNTQKKGEAGKDNINFYKAPEEKKRMKKIDTRSKFSLSPISKYNNNYIDLKKFRNDALIKEEKNNRSNATNQSDTVNKLEMNSNNEKKENKKEGNIFDSLAKLFKFGGNNVDEFECEEENQKRFSDDIELNETCALNKKEHEIYEKVLLCINKSNLKENLKNVRQNDKNNTLYSM